MRKSKIVRLALLLILVELPAQRSAAAAADIEETIRDPFQLPPLLQETLRQKEAARAAAQSAGNKPSSAATAAPTQPPPLKLQGILWGTVQPRAIINRKIVAVGDTVENAQVTSITPEGVTVSFAGQEYSLKLSTRNSSDNHMLSGREGVQKW